MIARTAERIPTGPSWCHEPKFDGFRALAFPAADGTVHLQSRQVRSLTTAFPEIAAAVARQCPGAVLDGELVCWRNGRLDFPGLQRRLGGGTASPVGYVVFDVLAVGPLDLRRKSYAARRERLTRLLAGARLPLALVPMTNDPEVALTWLTEHSAAGIEGVVSKHAEHTYSTRQRWRKVRTRLSGEAVVGGVIGPVRAPKALVLGLPDQRGRLRVVGQTLPLPRAARDELSVLLRPTDDHPWPETLHPRFGSSSPLHYTRVRPEVVVELDVDTARDQGRWRHPTGYRRVRLDLRREDLAVLPEA
ncbi:hypothetical protein [Pseudonocardia xishanensis]|uniref:ATP-dependent DNA ligase n=1 Tax=Pseudonocardia xishanensis TaxID=630995 RepID=A0ABP8RZ83_9PSEU